ncbi:hypothetical protein JCM16303_005758 [Sporobolomyces ruberrimus]
MMNRILNPSKVLSAPLRRTKDPLLASTVAQHFVLPSGNSFIIRPPPSVLPPTVPVPSQSNEVSTSSHPFLASLVASPLGNLSQSSSSSPSRDPSSLPPSRRTSPTSSSSTTTRLSPEQITQLQELRRSSVHSRSQIAKQFGVSPTVVGRFGYGKGSDAKVAEKVKRGELELEREEREAGWGWKKSIAREERRRRRTMW